MAIDFEILEHIGKLSESKSGWNKELNLVSWNGRDPKFDIRDWSPDYTKMGKGVTFTNDEIDELRTVLNTMKEE